MNLGRIQTFNPLYPCMEQINMWQQEMSPKPRTLLLRWSPAGSATRSIYIGLWAAHLPPPKPVLTLVSELLVFLNTDAIIPAQEYSVAVQGLQNEVQVLYLAFQVILVLFPCIHQPPYLTLERVAGGHSLVPGLSLLFLCWFPLQRMTSLSSPAF